MIHDILYLRALQDVALKMGQFINPSETPLNGQISDYLQINIKEPWNCPPHSASPRANSATGIADQGTRSTYPASSFMDKSIYDGAMNGEGLAILVAELDSVL